MNDEWIPPSATVPADPFALDPSMWPEAPDWLFHAVIATFAVSALVLTVLLVLWLKASREDRRALQARQPKEWVDLTQLDKKGRWADRDENPRAGGIER